MSRCASGRVCCAVVLRLGAADAVAGGARLLAGGGGAAAIALDVHLEDDGVVDEAIDGGARHGGIGEHAVHSPNGWLEVTSGLCRS